MGLDPTVIDISDFVLCKHSCKEKVVPLDIWKDEKLMFWKLIHLNLEDSSDITDDLLFQGKLSYEF